MVLGCNNFEVIDLGVMVPYAKILETAKAENADMIGLSGLITPSLEEMCTVAAEMERTGCDIPLRIGGATTSKIHTALKIAPNYKGPTLHVVDASRAVGVAGNLVSETQKDKLIQTTADEYQKLRASHSGKEARSERLPIGIARRQKFLPDWSDYTPPVPPSLGLTDFDNYDLADLVVGSTGPLSSALGNSQALPANFQGSSGRGSSGKTFRRCTGNVATNRRRSG